MLHESKFHGRASSIGGQRIARRQPKMTCFIVMARPSAFLLESCRIVAGPDTTREDR
jgi:hypothetical protein